MKYDVVDDDDDCCDSMVMVAQFCAGVMDLYSRPSTKVGLQFGHCPQNSINLHLFH
jgi:hypothetical protein